MTERSLDDLRVEWERLRELEALRQNIESFRGLHWHLTVPFNYDAQFENAVAESDVDEFFREQIRQACQQEDNVSVIPSAAYAGAAEPEVSEPQDLEAALKELKRVRTLLEQTRKVSSQQATDLSRLKSRVPKLDKCREDLKDLLDLFTDYTAGACWPRSTTVDVADIIAWTKDWGEASDPGQPKADG